MNASPVTTAVTAAGVTPAPGQGQAGLPGEVIMRARGLEMSFGQTHALRGVDLDVAAGEVLAVTGPSGSGKSTLLHVMAGVLVPDAGRVDYHGADTTQDIAALDEAARSRLRLNEFGFIFQFGQLLPDLSALDNVTIPLLLAGTPRRRALAQAREALGELGLSEHLDKRPTQLSGGQAQRAAVARGVGEADGETWVTLLARLAREAETRPSSTRLTVASPERASVAAVRAVGVGAASEDGATSSEATGACGAVRSVLSVLTRSPYACTR